MKKYFIGIIGLIIIIVGCTLFFHNTKTEYFKNDTVLTMNDKIGNNTAWVATFELLWSDLKDLTDNNIKSSSKSVKSLNNSDFKREYISSKDYYTAHGYLTKEFVDEIKTDLKNKFDEKSEILDKFSVNKNKYLLYAMLKKDFSFFEPFDVLENDKFKNTKNVKYFGINQSTSNSVGDQVSVLFYDSSNHFAFKVSSPDDEEILFYKNPKGKTFNEIYNNLIQKSSKYSGDKDFEPDDTLKIPYITLRTEKYFNDLENTVFTLKDKKQITIDEALETIELKLNEKGAYLKSEAGVTSKSSAVMEKPRKFYLNDDFVMFFREKNSKKPYFALSVNEIKDFQK